MVYETIKKGILEGLVKQFNVDVESVGFSPDKIVVYNSSWVNLENFKKVLLVKCPIVSENEIPIELRYDLHYMNNEGDYSFNLDELVRLPKAS